MPPKNPPRAIWELENDAVVKSLAGEPAGGVVKGARQ